MKNIITVYCDGVMHKITINELKQKKWNVVVLKTNGYSHDWEEIVPFDESLIQIVCDKPTIWCTTKEVKQKIYNSVVSFS
jgi:hypothetical protein